MWARCVPCPARPVWPSACLLPHAYGRAWCSDVASPLSTLWPNLFFFFLLFLSLEQGLTRPSGPKAPRSAPLKRLPAFSLVAGWQADPELGRSLSPCTPFVCSLLSTFPQSPETQECACRFVFCLARALWHTGTRIAHHWPLATIAPRPCAPVRQCASARLLVRLCRGAWRFGPPRFPGGGGVLFVLAHALPGEHWSQWAIVSKPAVLRRSRRHTASRPVPTISHTLGADLTTQPTNNITLRRAPGPSPKCGSWPLASPISRSLHLPHPYRPARRVVSCLAAGNLGVTDTGGETVSNAS